MTYLYIYIYDIYVEMFYMYRCSCRYAYIQPLADRVALNFEIVFKTFSTNQNSAHGIYH